MPAPQSRVPKGAIVTDPSTNMGDGQEDLIDMSEDQKGAHPAIRRLATDGPAPKANGVPNPSIRRTSSIVSTSQRDGPKKPKDHAHNLGPSNLASRPRTTRYNTVKIKPGGGPPSETSNKPPPREPSSEPRPLSASAAPQGGVGAGLLNSAGLDAKDGVMAVQAGYGTMGETPPKSKGRDSAPGNIDEISPNRTKESRERTTSSERRSRASSSHSSTVGSLRSLGSRSKSKTGIARSGSLSENVVHAGGIKKTVLETTSSSEEADGSGSAGQGQTDGAGDVETGKDGDKPEGSGEGGQQSQKKKRRRKKRSGKKGDEQPLMEE